MKRTARSLAILAVCTTMLIPSAAAGATGRSTAGLPQAAGTATVWRVKMLDGTRNQFRPARITIARGDVVKWRNRGDLTHTTTSNSWDSGRVSPGDSFRRRFRRSGTFTYHCSIHPEMTGTIVVR